MYCVLDGQGIENGYKSREGHRPSVAMVGILNVGPRKTQEQKEAHTMTVTAMRGKQIALEYRFKSEDNQVLDSNVGKTPFTYTQGANQVISGVESAVEGMSVGESKQVVVSPVDGFGEYNPNAVHEVDKTRLPNDIQIGAHLRLKDKEGRDLRPIVTQIKDHTALLDFNHPLAGKTLIFDLKVVGIE